MSVNVRALAAKCVFACIDKGRSLADELPIQLQKTPIKDHGLLQELVYGVVRYLPELEHDVRKLMDKPLKGKQRVFHHLLLVGIYQLKYTRIPDHAAVAETVAATSALKSRHFKALVNGILRNYLRKEAKPTDELLANPIRFNHPGWFINKVSATYPDTWQKILTENMQRPPMWLRVNKQKTSLDIYQALLAENEILVDFVDDSTGALRLTSPCDVTKLPHFDLGWVSVQDGAAQYAATLLDAASGDHVLDCCSAPGGKTCHILELTPNIGSMTALDVEANRLVRVEENLARLGLTAKVICADAADTSNWASAQQFDKILIDAPCSGTGVIRRHPDIKWLRKASDISQLVELQKKILTAIWQLLKPGGTLVYATCSVIAEENSQQIENFITNTDNAKLVNFPQQENNGIGWQILPGDNGMDGFYYAKLTKLT